MSMLYMRPKNLRRYRQILHVLMKYGFTYLVEKMNIDDYIYRSPGGMSDEIKNMTHEERIKSAIVELGPTFIKLGQILSTRGDLLDDAIIEQLSKLQDDVEAFSFEKVGEIFYNEMGITIEEAFLEFEKSPMAAASIGQVHRARTRKGKRVIVKVQRPGIEAVISSDTDILYFVAKLLQERIDKKSATNYMEIVDEFSASIKREMDYNFEARNCEKFAQIHKNDEDIYIPRVYWEFTSKKVLALEMVEGVKISDVDEIKRRGWDCKTAAFIEAKAFMKQVFSYGFFHADLHPGNVFVLDKGTIAFVDFGIVGVIDKDTKKLINQIFSSINDNNVDGIVDCLVQLDAVDPDSNIRKLKEDLSFYIYYYYNTPLERISITELIREFLYFARKNRVALPTGFTMLAKTIVTLEGTGKKLYPEFSISMLMDEFLRQSYMDIERYRESARETRYYIESILRDVKSIPEQIRWMLNRIRKNNIRISVEEIRFSLLEREISKMTNRLSASLIISAIIVGSSIVIVSGKGPDIKGYPAIGLLGYSIATIMGFFLVFSMLFSRNRNK
ncbi:ABC-1 domain protein [Peptoclostridium acidaminophilum DSM 3953]|uniref:ABC-1 domain protein n=2 Tax=Peptoclostridium acidaminophilum TaxID=1731 RepID=W8TJ91_PEPAC|nr:ABC-1 domain protein [Peptoclostridium acidaminophilum DSM 3953]